MLEHPLTKNPPTSTQILSKKLGDFQMFSCILDLHPFGPGKAVTKSCVFFTRMVREAIIQEVWKLLDAWYPGGPVLRLGFFKLAILFGGWNPLTQD